MENTTPLSVSRVSSILDHVDIPKTITATMTTATKDISEALQQQQHVNNIIMNSSTTIPVSRNQEKGVAIDVLKNPYSPQLHTSRSRSNSASNNIEEPLIQINDHLNQASLLNDIDMGGDGDGLSTNIKATTAEDNPVANNKSICSKLTGSSLTWGAIANETADFENNSKINHFPVLQANGDGIDVNKSPNTKFIELPQFDEANIPEIPCNLNHHIEDELNLEFEHQILTRASGSSHSTITNAANSPHLMVQHESDTAVSSDNETFAECQSYQDLENITNDLAPVEISELETYRSAISARDKVDEETGNVADNVNSNNETMENIPGIPEEEENVQGVYNELQLSASITTVIAREVPEKSRAKGEIEGEPMDVDMNTTQELLHYSANATAEADYLLPRQNSQATLNYELEIHEAKHELSLNKSIELPVNCKLEKQLTNECIIQTSSVAQCIFSDNILTQQVEAPSPSSSSSISAETVVNGPSLDIESEIEAKIDVTLRAVPMSLKKPFDKNFNVNSSPDNARSPSSPNSPTFPLKLSNALKQFPHSQAPNASKEMTFLEKSEFTERVNRTSSRKTSTIEARPKVSAQSQNITTYLNETIDIDQSNASHTLNNITTVVNDAALDSPLNMDINKIIIMASDRSNKRRTFDIADPADKENDEISVKTETLPVTEHLIADADKRLTFNVNVVESPPTELNESLEPMDVDVTMSIAPSPPPIIPPRSPAIPAKSSQDMKVATAPPPPSSPPIPTVQKSKIAQLRTSSSPPPLPIRQNNKIIAPPSPPLPTLLKRRPLDDNHSEMSPHGSIETLSVKEQIQSNSKDEKDIVFVDSILPSPMENVFKLPVAVNSNDNFNMFYGNIATAGNCNTKSQDFSDDDFQCCTNIILNPSDFDYLLTKGSNNNNVPASRSSLLIRFDPLLGVPVPVNQPQQLQQSLSTATAGNTNNSTRFSPTIEEDENHQQQQNSNDSSRYFSVDKTRSNTLVEGGACQKEHRDSKESQQNNNLNKQRLAKSSTKNARMSVDVIKDMNVDNDCNKSFENSNCQQSGEKHTNFKMDELEKKIKNEVLKTEDIGKKLKEAEQREEALIKRITEKDKTITKMNGVIESYEKTIAELVREKEQIIQTYEKQLTEVKADRDSNYHHLTSLETTFSDLHVKYEKSKEMTSQLKSSEEALLSEKRQNLENLRLQEQRYEKMKNHAMQQLEIANKKLESLTKEHAIETTKLKALLKKEEISRASINEQLQQKSRENAELVKICDELINGQGS